MGHLKRLGTAATPQRIASGFCLGVLCVTLGSLVAATLAHEFQVLRSSRPGNPYPMPVYRLMPSPGTSPVADAPGAAGGDFSQVYTSALALRHGESAYFPTTSEFADRFGRRAGYPPLMNWLYVPLSLLDYYDALVVHTVLTLALLFGTTALVLWKTGLRRHIPGVVLAQSSLFFLTPIGFTHFERGQFDLIVATACVLCMACVFMQRGWLWLALATGFLGALKWTSAAFLGCFCALGFLLSAPPRRWAFPLILALMVLGTALFWREVGEYWYTIERFEINARPRGLTFQHFVPRRVAKVIPVMVTLIVMGLALARTRSVEERGQLFMAISVPFAITLMNLAICYGTVSFEYHTVSALGIIPGLVVWTEKEAFVSRWLKALTCAAFGLFLFLAFRTFLFTGRFSAIEMTQIYAEFTVFFFGLCAYALLDAASAIRAQAAKPAADHQ